MVRRLLFFSILFLLTFSLPLRSQDLWTTLDYQTTNTGNNGMIGQWTMAIMQDLKQRIWFGTESGISIKDGSTWTAITKSDGLRENEVGDLVEDNHGHIWIGYGSYITGISKLSDGTFTHFNTNNVLLHDKVECIFRDRKDNIWIANWGGLNRYDGENWYSYTSENGFANSYPTSIAEDTLGNIWIGTKSDGLWYYDGAAFNYHVESGSPKGGVYEVFIDKENRIWVYTPSGVYIHEQFWNKVSSYDNSFGVVRDINQSSDSTIFICTSQGMYLIDPTFEITHYSTAQDIPHDNTLTSALINDRIFIGTADGYAYFEDDRWFSSFTSEDGIIHNDINHIFSDSNGDIWFCTQGGISKYNGSAWESYRRTPGGNEIEWVSSGLQDRNGEYWFTTVHGVFRFDGNEWKIHDYSENAMFNGWGQDIIEDRQGNIWVASWNYVLKYDGDLWIHYDHSSGFEDNHCDGIFEDSRGRIWVGNRAQISVWENGNWEHHIPEIIYNLDNPAVNSFIEDSVGSIIVSAYHGSYIYKDNEWDFFTGSPSVWHFDSFLDKNHVMWFGTFGGLVVYDGISQKTYMMEDGLTSNTVKAVHRDHYSGEIWIGTDLGITNIRPDIEVTDIYMSNSALRVSTAGISKPYHYSLDGRDYSNTSGEFEILNEEDITLYITNKYDTVEHSNLRSYIISGLESPPIKPLLYPNPTKGNIIITKPGIVKILNIHGDVIMKKEIIYKNTSIELKGIQNGVYVIRIESDGKIAQTKLIKK